MTPPVNPKYEAIIYSRPGCMRCRTTLRALTRMGVHCTERLIDDHEEALETMRNLHWTQLPLVEVTAPDGSVTMCCGMHTAELEALRRRLTEQS